MKQTMTNFLRLNFYQGKRVLITGHTGFKGAWLSNILLKAGASVTGYALPPTEGDSLYQLLCLGDDMQSVFGDVRDYERLFETCQMVQPEIIFHLAAQPLVLESYRAPVSTYATNVMGTVHILECARMLDSVRSVVNITTDKVYKNQEWVWGYRENEQLDGYDPYSNSKSCSELVTASYARSFLHGQGIAVSTARAGNVIGGGDFAKDRIIPDCIRAAGVGQAIVLRNPNSVRPYQHVLEPLSAYLLIAQSQYEDVSKAGAYNVGPKVEDCITTAQLVELFCRSWGEGCRWEPMYFETAPHESMRLRLDCTRIHNELRWNPQWDISVAVGKTVDWTKAYLSGYDMRSVTETQISEYFKD